MVATEFPWLSVVIALPVVACLLFPYLPNRPEAPRLYALGISALDFGLILFAFWRHFHMEDAGYQLAESYTWMSQINLNWAVSVDGLSMPLIILTGVINLAAIAAAWRVEKRSRLFFALVLLLFSAQLGVFMAQDLLMFFLMWELELVPVYLLIAIWGGPKRQYAATKFILYTALGSLFILVSAFALAFYGDTTTFDIAQLGYKQLPYGLELAVYAGLLVAFGVKLPVFPFHTWLPDAHGEASAPISMILAGVLLKMGGYALIRLNVELLPHAHLFFAPVLVVLGVVNIIYGALTAFGQDNLKRRLACSSISHMGFVLVGIGSLSEVGLNGAMLQMLSHGLIAAMLFFLVGVAYERTHTLDMDEMGGLAQAMPKTFALFTTGALASLALPGMSGFVGELMVFLGIANSDYYTDSFRTVVVILAAIGLILTPIYLLSMLRRVFAGAKMTTLDFSLPQLDIKPREMAIALVLIVPIITIGLYPRLATQTYDAKVVAVTASVQQSMPLYAQLRQDNPLLSKVVAAEPTPEIPVILAD